MFKLYKRTTVIRNLVIFIFFSFFYSHLIMSLSLEESAIETLNINGLGTFHKFLAIFSAWTMYQIFYVKKHSSFFLLTFIGLIFVQIMYNFYLSEDKMILSLGFLYLVLSFYFYLLWKLELEDSIYRPGFFSNQISPKHEYPFDVVFKYKDGSEVKGIISNWSESSFFITSDNMANIKRGLIDVCLTYDKIKFSFLGDVVTQCDGGMGVKVIGENDNENYKWSDFYNIITDRGYVARFR